MAISERLALLVTLDAQGAVKGFNDLGKAADKNLGKADQKLDRMGSRFQKAGAGMLATAGLLGVGLYKAGQAAADLEQAVGGTEAVFGEASAAIDDYAKKAARAAGLSESAFRTATTSIGGQLKGLGFSTSEAADEAVKLTQVAADLSATYGGTTAEAVQALGAAFRGEADPAERFNLFLNQTRVNAKAVELGLAASTSQVDAQAKAQAVLALVTEQSADAQGQFAREAGTAAGQLAIASAEIENAKASLGEAVAPVIADVAGGLADIAGGFTGANEASGGFLAKLAAVGTVGLAAAGGLSFTVGKVIDARERFGELAEMTRGLRGRLSDLSPTMKGLGGAFAFAGIAAVAFAEDQKKVSDGAKDLRTEAEATGESLEATFRKKISDAITEAGSLRAGLDAAGVSFNEVANALTGTDEQFAAFIRSLFNTEAGVDANIGKLTQLRAQYVEAGTQASTASTHVVGLREATSGQAEAADTAATATGGFTDKVDLNKEALDRATESANKFKQGLDDAFGDLTIEEASDRRAAAFEDMASRFEDAQQSVQDAKQRVADLQAMKKEDRPDSWARDLAAAQQDVREAIDETSRTLMGNSEVALQNREDIRGVVDDIGAIIQKHRDEKASLEDLLVIREMEKQNLVEQLEQLGFNRDEIQRYIDAIDAIPITKATTINIDTATAEARLKAARDRWQKYLDQNPLSIDVAQAEKFADGSHPNDPRRAIGGPVSAGSSYLVGEYRPEVFTPSVNGTVSPLASTSGASSQVNHITINNPTQEPANQSIRKVRSELAA